MLCNRDLRCHFAAGPRSRTRSYRKCTEHARIVHRYSPTFSFRRFYEDEVGSRNINEFNLVFIGVNSCSDLLAHKPKGIEEVRIIDRAGDPSADTELESHLFLEEIVDHTVRQTDRAEVRSRKASARDGSVVIKV